MSVVLNVSRVLPPPVLLFVYGFLSPLAFAWVALRIWPVGQVVALSRSTYSTRPIAVRRRCAIRFSEICLVWKCRTLLQERRRNGYQLVFFLLVFSVLVAGIATFEPQRRTAKFSAPVLLGLAFLIIFLAQYRALLVSAASTVVFVGLILGSQRARGLVIGSIGVVAFVEPRIRGRRLPRTGVRSLLTPSGKTRSRSYPRDSIHGGTFHPCKADDPLYAVAGTRPWDLFQSRMAHLSGEVGDPASGTPGAEAPYASAPSAASPIRLTCRRSTSSRGSRRMRLYSGRTS